MGKYWKTPIEKSWYMVEVDGNVVGILEESASTKKEIDRIKDLAGVEVMTADHKSLLKFRARTVIPARIVAKLRSS